jgi:chemotaxis protein CheD
MSSIVVGIAEFKLAEPPRKLVTYGLGSCVAIVLHSLQDGVGSMAHVMLPYAYSEKESAAPGKFADSAVGAMVRQMEDRGVGTGHIVAKIAGGADMFAGQFKGAGSRIGARNIIAVHKALDAHSIPLLAEDVGGSMGRTVEFTVETGQFVVRTLRGVVKEL